MANPKLFRVIDKAVKDYSMIEVGDKVLLAASGGKDSTALAEYLSFRKTHTDFSVTALHISTELENAQLTNLETLFKNWQIDFIVKHISVLGRLKSGQKMNCWWCSTQRRLELLNFALEFGYNKIAFGHHLDDILETVLMNVFTKGRLVGMPPILQFDKFPIKIIRPLALADIPMIQSHVTTRGYASTTCTCEYQSNSHRKVARERLQNLTGGNYELKLKLFNALKKDNIVIDYLN
jgi:PP-loop domain protein